jgi:hypothetical protein
MPPATKKTLPRKPGVYCLAPLLFANIVCHPLGNLWRLPPLLSSQIPISEEPDATPKFAVSRSDFLFNLNRQSYRCAHPVARLRRRHWLRPSWIEKATSIL